MRLFHVAALSQPWYSSYSPTPTSPVPSMVVVVRSDTLLLTTTASAGIALRSNCMTARWVTPPAAPCPTSIRCALFWQ